MTDDKEQRSLVGETRTRFKAIEALVADGHDGIKNQKFRLFLERNNL